MFQAGFYRVLLAHPQSAAHGLTLTKGTATIWASPTYNLEHSSCRATVASTAPARLERTETIVIIAAGTIEEAVYQRLLDKNLKQLSMLDLLRDVLRRTVMTTCEAFVLGMVGGVILLGLKWASKKFFGDFS
jgi:hypothetical protein